MDATDGPFGQRKTGRRAQRRQAREAAAAAAAAAALYHGGGEGDDQHEAKASTSLHDVLAASSHHHEAESSESSNYNKKKNSPSDEIQSRIDAAISLRAGHGVAIGDVHVDTAETAGNATHDAETTNQQQRTQQRQVLMEPDVLESARYEYLDHTADVQLHSWGHDITDALGQLAVAMFGCMTSLQTIEVDEHISAEVASNVVAKGHDLHSLIFSFLDEWLFVFHDSGFIAREVEIVDFDREAFVLRSRGRGEILDLSRHPQGTEVKAITYSNMQIEEKDDDERGCDIWVIVDI